jgi:hypothetical protein
MNLVKMTLTLYIANRAFGGLQKFSANENHSKLDRLLLSTVLLTIDQMFCAI